MLARKLVALILVILVVGIMLTVLPVYPVSGTNIGYGAYGGYSDVQIFNFHSGNYVSFAFHCWYSQNRSSILFSIKRPDGSFVIQDSNVSQNFSYSFMPTTSGYYYFNFSDPYHPVEGGGFGASLNITVYEPLVAQYFYGINGSAVKLPS